jgi:hypothetical protein
MWREASLAAWRTRRLTVEPCAGCAAQLAASAIGGFIQKNEPRSTRRWPDVSQATSKCARFGTELACAYRSLPRSPHIFFIFETGLANREGAIFLRFFRAKRFHRRATRAWDAIADLALCWGTLAKRAIPWYFLRIFPSLTTEPSFSCGCCRKESGQLWVEGTGDVLDPTCGQGFTGRGSARSVAGHVGRVAHLM